jgi:prolyl 4-hydroxylase
MSVIPSFMTAPECAWMIELGRPKLKRGKVYGEDARGSEVVTGRTNTAASLLFQDVDVVTVFLTARMANSIGLPTEWFEPPTVLHYAPGEEFRQHFDFLSSDIPGQAAELARGGQRIATLLVYLNDDYEGGETEFSRLGLRHKGKRGDAFVFGNVLPSGEPDVRTLHSGTPTSRGEKWVLSQWIRNRNTT